MGTIGDLEIVEQALSAEEIAPGDKIQFKFLTDGSRPELISGVYQKLVSTGENPSILLEDGTFWRTDRIVASSIKKIN